jgi:uncharacterized glyoxalase superfamily protein PhnB
MSDAGTVRLWPAMTFRDADAMMGWLKATGFEEHAAYRDEQDPSVVVHAEYVWPGGGAGLMFGSHREGRDLDKQPGTASVYLVVDDPDAAFEAAVAAGATVLRAMVDQDYGGRGGSVADPEGNVWSFGNYQPA